MLLIGGTIGIAAAIGLGHAARSLLYELQAYDPVAVVMAALMLGAVSLAAGFIPARRAALENPMSALRND
jgi:ABC-type antimicrobial peptide transport system permease subunit